MNIAKGTIFLLLPGLGMVGNLYVIVNYMWTFFLNAENKLIHLILIHLTFTNIIMILTKGMPQMMVAFGVKNFLHDTGCKMVIFFGRVARGLSICTYSLLTVVQAVTISPRASVWGRHQTKAVWHIFPCFLFFWMLNSLINMHLFNIITSNSRNESHGIENLYYCDFKLQGRLIQSMVLTGRALHDALFLGLTAVASGYMVFLLHKHHKHTLYLQNTKRVYTTPPEIKAAQCILLLMLCFLLFYWTDYIITSCVNYSLKSHFTLILVQELISLGHVILSPFVMIYRDRRLSKCWHIWET